MLLKYSGTSKSGYYKWAAQRKQVDPSVERIQKLYGEVKGIYGYRRLKAAYEQRYGEVINHKKIYRIMRELDIRSIIRRKRKYYGNASKIIKLNILGQNFMAEKSNSKWSTDITNLYYKNIRFYLCVILDLYNREILSYIHNEQ